MASTIPYIGSKISLISNSEIRYEGILYTINTQESTIALQSVKTFGTEGRKIPEIPPSSEIYDFIIFRGQDIKDLTVLESAGQGQSSPMAVDPAIMSMNQRPSGGGPKGKEGGKAAPAKGAGKERDRGWEQPSKGSDRGWEQPSKGSDRGWEQPSKGASKGMPAWSQPATSWKGDGWGKGGGKWDEGKGRGGQDGWGKGGGQQGWGGKGKEWPVAEKGWGGGKASKGGKDGGKSYGKDGGKSGGKSGGKGGKDGGKASKGGGGGKSSGKGDRGGNRSRGGAGATVSGVPVGELLPEENSDAKKEFAEEFDVDASNTKFEKITDDAEQAVAKPPLSGYSKSSSFFDNISCEATDRAGDVERQKVDREQAREHDKETFGDTRRPPRPVGVRRGKGKGKGFSK